MATELNEHGHIPGIYNYCDRWCEKCRFQLKCLLYAGQADEQGNLTEPDDAEEAMQRLDRALNAGDDSALAAFTNADEDDDGEFDLPDPNSEEGKAIEERLRRQDEKVYGHLLHPLSRTYSDKALDWLKKHEKKILKRVDQLSSSANAKDLLAEPNADARALRDAFDTIAWHVHQIHVKTMRALHGLYDEDDVWEDEIQTDYNGSAKVSLLGIENSAQAFETVIRLMDWLKDETAPLIERLKALVTHIEQEFPNARKFVRVGFDTGD